MRFVMETHYEQLKTSIITNLPHDTQSINRFMKRLDSKERKLMIQFMENKGEEVNSKKK